jgi:DNA-binding transcriptional LysR family regulator
MLMDTLTRMRAFIDVVEAEGFSAAARKIGRSKALLSKYVRELEDELGALLLNRTTRQFSLTEAGHTYFQRASQLVREIDTLCRKPSAMPPATSKAESRCRPHARSPTRSTASR